MEDEKQFERGSSLSIFASDRMEDIGALIAAFCIALAVVVLLK